MLSRLGLTKKALAQPLGSHEWRLPDLARKLDLAAAKLRAWAERGWIHARRTPPQNDWILWADRQELRRLRRLKRQSKPGVFAHATDLKKRPERKETLRKTRTNSSPEGNDVL
jgi:hypothetical protein